MSVEVISGNTAPTCLEGDTLLGLCSSETVIPTWISGDLLLWPAGELLLLFSGVSVRFPDEACDGDAADQPLRSLVIESGDISAGLVRLAGGGVASRLAIEAVDRYEDLSGYDSTVGNVLKIGDGVGEGGRLVDDVATE
mmetsp:Transcript_27277/g.49728  ORF Transcript_27277/g.49728 Transcript_27277/m.49728 type:complete len:139 (-) Transcript_27277:185-601(-)